MIDIFNADEVPIEIINHTREFEELPFEFHGDLKDFQIDACEDLIPKNIWENVRTLSAPTGSGKTVIGVAMICYHRQPTVIIVHTKELLYQWIERIHKFMNIPKNRIGIVGDGKRQVKNITVCLIQTLYKHAEHVAKTTGFLIVDECHRISSRTFLDGVTAFDCKYILGLSATPYRRDGLGVLIPLFVGKVAVEVKPKELRKDGHILSIRPIFRETNFVPSMPYPEDQYSKMMTELTSDEDRNWLIANDIYIEYERNRNGTILVLSDRKQHCLELQRMLESMNCNSFVLTSSVNADERNEIVNDVKDGKIRILIATGQLIGEGFDCPEMSILFLTTPISYKGRFLQYVGRVLRPSKGKKEAVVYDYVDVNVGILNNSANKRRKWYV